MPNNIFLRFQEWYAQSFMELCAFEGKQGDRDTLKSFVDALSVIQARHVNAVQTMAQGVLELKEAHSVDPQTESSIQYFLDRFYMSRISTRMLTNQHSMLFGDEDGRDPRPHRVGVIDTECKLGKLVQEAFDNAAFLCEEYYFCSPDLEVEEHNALAPGQAIEVCHPPQHLYHIFFELFKNAMRAVIETKKKNIMDIPDIRVQIAKGPREITIKISDQVRQTYPIFGYKQVRQIEVFKYISRVFFPKIMK